MSQLPINSEDAVEYRNFFQNLINSGHHFLFSFHENPDPDSIGSNLAFALVLKVLGKEPIVVWGPSGPQAEFNYLSQYIDQVGVFNAKVSETIKDSPRVNTLVMLDSATSERIGLSNRDILNFGPEIKSVFAIDHHAGNDMSAIRLERKLIKTHMSSTCEMLAKMFYLYDPKLLTPEVCELLKVGMWSDTGGFTYSSATSEAFSWFNMLIQINSSLVLIQTMERSKTLIDLAIGKKIMEQLDVFKYQDILCGIVVMDQKTIDDAAYFQFTKHIPKDQLDFEANQSPHLAVDLLDRYGDIDVLFIAFAYKKNGKQSYRISVRSYGEKGNGLTKMIAEQFGGSGHHNAAGGQFLEEDKYLITTKIMNAINIKKNK
mgnify:CR=1 FL=1